MGLKNNENQQEDTFKHYSYPEEVLNSIRALVPNNVKDNSVKPCKVSYCNVSLVVNFGRFIEKCLRQKFIFSKVALSN